MPNTEGKIINLIVQSEDLIRRIDTYDLGLHLELWNNFCPYIVCRQIWTSYAPFIQ